MAYLSYSTSFDGNADYLQVSNNSAFLFGAGDFTLECWLFSNNISAGEQALMNIWDDYSTVPQAWDFRVNGNGKVSFQIDVATADTVIFISTATLLISQWYHIAVTRSGNTFRLFINGTLDSTTTNSGTISSGTGPLCIGGYFGSAAADKESANGYLSNVRIVKGTAVYTSAFTPSILPLDTIPNMSLLACRSATTVDNSTNNFTITTVGSPTVTNTNTPFSVASAPVTPTTYTKQIPSVVSTTKQSTELTSLDGTSIQESSLSIQVPNQKYIPGVSSTTKQTTELTSLDSTNNYSVTVSANLVGKKEIPSVPSVTRFSTFIKTSNDPIVDEAAGATINQTWTLS
jgi:hypothetical protein